MVYFFFVFFLALLDLKSINHSLEKKKKKLALKGITL